MIRSRELVEFINGPLHTTCNLIQFAASWQEDIARRVFEGEAIPDHEFTRWADLVEITQGLLAQIVWEVSGKDLYTPESTNDPNPS